MMEIRFKVPVNWNDIEDKKSFLSFLQQKLTKCFVGLFEIAMSRQFQ